MKSVIKTRLIVIEPVRAKTYDLTALVRKITPANQHAEVDFGAPVGKGKKSEGRSRTPKHLEAISQS
jgi:antitoxin component of MazEF toxin-antitoxin module